MNPYYSLLMLWSETEQRYFANIPELHTYCVGAGATLAEAAQKGQAFLEEFLPEYEAARAHKKLRPLAPADVYENHSLTPRQFAEQKTEARMRLLAMPPEEAQSLVDQTLYPQFWNYDPDTAESQKVREWDWLANQAPEWEPKEDV